MRKTIKVESLHKEQMIDVTAEISDLVTQSGIRDGRVTCFVPHTTAGITINENADPSVVRDILFGLDRAVPDQGFHHAEGNSTAHIKSSLMGSSIGVLVDKGRLVLGTWQGIYFCEFDGPRNRRLIVAMDSI